MPLYLEQAPPQDIDFDSSVVVGVRTIEGLPKGYYNAAAYQLPYEDQPEGLHNTAFLVGRYIDGPGQEGAPDIGDLVIASVTNGRATSLTRIWDHTAPENNDYSLEDGRIVSTPDGSLHIDLTRVEHTDSGYLPYPAFTIARPDDLISGMLPSTQIITNHGLPMPPGKNVVPLGRNQRVMYRPDSDNHHLVAFTLDESGEATNQQRVAMFNGSAPPWAEFRAGLTTPPVWLNEHEALLPIHGIQMVKGLYRYTVGSSRLYRFDDDSVVIDNVSPSPHITPELLAELFPGQQTQLWPELRQALYLCGAVVKYRNKQPETLVTYPSLGDLYTVEAALSISGITRAWDRSEPAHI